MRNLKLIDGLPYEVPPIIDITDDLPRKKRWEDLKKKWNVQGVWDGKTYQSGFRKPEQIDTIVVHHSGPPEGTIESHAKFHMRKWGAGIAYHIIIDGGKIKQTNDLRSMTYHAANNNTYTVGICINRDLTKKDITDAERKLLYAAILTVKRELKIKAIIGHNQVANTACPATDMDTIRKDVAELEDMYDVPVPVKSIDDRFKSCFQQLSYRCNLGIGKLPDGTAATPGQMAWGKAQILLLEREMKKHGMLD